LNAGRLAVSGCGHRFVFQEGSWLEHEFKNESKTGLWRIENGYLAAQAASRTDSTFGSQIAICQPAIPAASENTWLYRQHEPFGKL
jgi:hypothetical protein